MTKDKLLGLSSYRWALVAVLFTINATSIIFFPSSWPRQDPFGIVIQLVGVLVGAYITVRVLSWAWDSLIVREEEQDDF